MMGTNLLIWCIVGVILNSVPWVNSTDKFLMCPKESSCQRAAQQIISNIDEEIDPCQNFFKFVCGKSLRETSIPDNEYKMNQLALNQDRMQKEIKLSLETESPPDELNAFKLAKKFYKSCMNIAAIHAQGLNPLREMVRKFGGWPMVAGDNWDEENFSWIEIIYRINDANHFSNRLIITELDSDARNIMRLSLTPPGVEDMGRKLSANVNWIIEVAVLLGADTHRAKKEMEDVVTFEAVLKNYHFNSSKMAITVGELIKLHPTIAWTEFLQRQLPANITIDENEEIFIDSNYISHLLNVMSRTPKRVQANYLMYGLTVDLTMFMSQISEIKNLEQTLIGQPPHRERSTECFNHVLGFMPTSVAALYVRKYYANETRHKIMQLFSNVKERFEILMLHSGWMGNDAQQYAISKVRAMGNQTAYPNEVLDDAKLEEYYEGLIIDENDFYQNLYNLVGLKKKNAFKNLRRPAPNVNYNYEELTGNRTFFKAQYSQERNEMDITFDGLRMFFEDSDLPIFVNLAKLGSIIGRGISHGFDSHGRKYGKNGQFFDWWSNTPAPNAFNPKTQCLIEQFDNYTMKGLRSNLTGYQTLNENMADNVGVLVAYDAFIIQRIPNDGLQEGYEGLPYTQNQWFWLTYASSWCSVEQEQWAHYITTESLEAPNEFRVNGALSNLPEFAKDFNCPANSKMNPENKCTLWRRENKL